MKKFLFLCALSFFCSSLFSQTSLGDLSKSTMAVVSIDSLEAAAKRDTSYWLFPGFSGLNFGQTAFVNWAEGGENSVTLNAFLRLNANYRRKKLLWDNNLSAEYGLFYSKSYKNYNLRKNSDKLSFSSKLGYHAAKHWYYMALLDFKTQFSAGYDYPTENTRTFISDFLSPAYLITSLGMDYIPNKYVSVYLAPATGRFTFVCDTTLSSNYGLNPGEKTKSEFGAFARILNNVDIMKNVNLNSKLELFSAYRTFGNVVVNWDVLITMKVNKFVNASIRTQVKYDDAVKNEREIVNSVGETVTIKEGSRIQFMDAISIGFAYNF
jgi:hypothetical protein